MRRGACGRDAGRGALLGLADELEMRGCRSGYSCEECPAHGSPECEGTSDPCELRVPRYAARRIREALGVRDG